MATVTHPGVSGECEITVYDIWRDDDLVSSGHATKVDARNKIKSLRRKAKAAMKTIHLTKTLRNTPHPYRLAHLFYEMMDAVHHGDATKFEEASRHLEQNGYAIGHESLVSNEGLRRLEYETARMRRRIEAAKAPEVSTII